MILSFWQYLNFELAIIYDIALLPFRHAPKLSMHSLKGIETTNDMPFYLVETSEGTYLLSYWEHNQSQNVTLPSNKSKALICFTPSC